MAIENQPNPTPNEIASQICRIVEIHPITLKMTSEEIADARSARDQELERLYPDATLRHQAKTMLGVVQQGEEREWHFEHIKSHAAELWLPVQSADLLSGYVPIPPIMKKGNNAEIWKCESRFAKLTQVVKLLTSKDNDPTLLSSALALNELQNHYRLNHPNIVQIFEAGRLKIGDNQFPFVAMEHLDGITLETWIKRSDLAVRIKHGPRIIATVASAIQFCHEFGISHGDLHPGNIFLCGGLPDPKNIKVLDFGYATGLNGAEFGFAPDYSDPNKGGHHHAMVLKDIFALGAILHTIIIGKPLQLQCNGIDRHEWDDAVNALDLGNSDLSLICRKCLSWAFADRYDSALQVNEDLIAYETDHPLPHARKNNYSWRERTILLFKRGKEHDNPKDHQQIIALGAFALAIAPASLAPFFFLNRLLGFDNSTAFMIANIPVMIYAFVLLIWIGYQVNFQRHSRKILVPLIAVLMAFIGIMHFNAPAVWGTSMPSYQEIAKGAPYAVATLAVMWICYAAYSSEWKVGLYVGWFALLTSFLLRPLFDTESGSMWMPVVLGLFEVAGCLAFGMMIFKSSKLKDEESNTSPVMTLK